MSRILIATWPHGISLVRSTLPTAIHGVQEGVRCFWLMRGNDKMAELKNHDDFKNQRGEQEWEFNTQDPFFTLSRLEARGLVASALCEVICDGKVPTMSTPFNASAYFTEIDLEEGTRIVDGTISDWGDSLRMTLRDYDRPEHERRELSRSLGEEASSEIHGVVGSWLANEYRVSCGVSARTGAWAFEVSIAMPTSIHSDIKVYQISGGIDVPSWEVASFVRLGGVTRPSSTRKDILSQGQPTFMEALKHAGLVIDLHDGTAKVVWVDKALEHGVEPVWAPGLKEAVEPGRFLGVDPLMLPSEDFLAWIEAAGLQNLKTEGST